MPAPGTMTLQSPCTSVEAFDAGLRTMIVDNAGPTTQVTLVDRSSGGSVSGPAPTGRSAWTLEATAGDTVLLTVGAVIASAEASHTICAVLDGNAECSPDTGRTTVTWAVTNHSGNPRADRQQRAGPHVQPQPGPPTGRRPRSRSSTARRRRFDSPSRSASPSASTPPGQP